MVIPLTWDVEGVTECALCTKAFVKGKAVDQLQIHRKVDGTYHILSRCFDEEGNQVASPGMIEDFDTSCSSPTFALVTPAVPNTRVDMSPYGQSVFADAVDAIQSVDLAFDALINEVDGTGKNINFMVVEKSAVIKFDKHVAGKVFRPDELENLDSYMMKYRKYGIVELLDNKLDGVYVSAHTA